MIDKITVKNLSKSFSHKHVLNGINLSVGEGKSLVVIGGSGSGKSVLLKNILGIMRPDEGQIYIDGEDVTGLSGHKRSQMMAKFGMLFQGGALFDSLPVWENIAFVLLQQHRSTRKEANQLAVEKLADVGLSKDIANLYPAELSGGMQKRVALARAIAARPDIIFFDEPTTGLDPIMADIINNLIIQLSEQLGATTITITHDMDSARKIADSVAMIHNGQIIWHDDIGKLDHSDNAYVDQFIHGRAEGPIKMVVQDHF